MKTATFTTELGTKTWEVTSDKVVDFGSFTTSYELDAEDDSAVEGSPLYTERGLKKQTVSFATNLTAQLGVDVREEIEGWKEWVGQTGILKIGGVTFGPNFLLTTVKVANTKVDTKGRFHFAKLTFTFEESDDEVDDSIVEAAEEANAETEETTSAVNVTASTAAKSLLKSINTFIANLIK